MNSYNHIEKVKYTDVEKQLVALKEYIIFEDDRTENKYVVFKFVNNLTQPLYEIRVEVSEFDENENLIAKSIISYDGFKALEQETFVPNAKLKVQFSCKRVHTKLLYAKFERLYWENGVFNDIPYSFSQYQGENAEASKKTKKQKKAEIKALKEENKHIAKVKKLKQAQEIADAKKKYELKEKKISRKDIKKRFEIRSIYKTNKTGFINFLTTVLSIAGVAFVAYSTVVYYNQNKDSFFTYNNYYYQTRSISNEVAVMGRKSTNSNKIELNSVIEVEQKEDISLDDIVNLLLKSNTKKETKTKMYAITEVGEKAFANDEVVTSVTFASNVKVSSKAFYNATNLKSIDGEKIKSIYSSAFEGTSISSYTSSTTTYVGKNAFAKSSLTKIDVMSASLDVGCFTDCNMKSIYCGSISQEVKTLGDLFGCDNGKVPSTLDLYILDFKLEDKSAYTFVKGCPGKVTINGIDVSTLESVYK